MQGARASAEIVLAEFSLNNTSSKPGHHFKAGIAIAIIEDNRVIRSSYLYNGEEQTGKLEF